MNGTKTNAMRILDGAKVPYRVYEYEPGETVDGVSVAHKIGMEARLVYKTLVTQAKSGEHLVFVIPVEKELDLKKAARAAGEKSVEMLPLKDLTKVTGYIRGGCSPVGMKKPFRTVIDLSAQALAAFAVSGGRVGLQVELSPEALSALIGGVFADIVQ